jgi:hypothetical protein
MPRRFLYTFIDRWPTPVTMGLERCAQSFYMIVELAGHFGEPLFYDARPARKNTLEQFESILPPTMIVTLMADEILDMDHATSMFGMFG